MPHPNLLVIMSDQHNPHVLGCAGDPYVRTPHLDRLAAAGVRFSQSYCPGPLCVPSRMAFMTGQYPCDLRIWTNSGVLGTDVPTFAHQLSLAGYETGLCGRMHFGGPDQHHGFERRLVGDVSGAMVSEGRDLFENVWDRAGCGQDYRSLLAAAAGPGRATYEVYDEAVTERACRFLDGYARGPRQRPFCLVVGLLLPHNPYVCAPDLFAEYMDKLPRLPVWPGEPGSEHPAVVALRRTRGAARITPEMARRGRAAYFGLVTTLDRSVGRVLDALAAAGLAADTAVVYTSDHGDLAGEHGLWWKDSFYEGSVGVPLIWSWPGHFRTGYHAAIVTGLLDLAPTLIDLAGAEPLPGARGSSLMPGLTSDQGRRPWPDLAYAETCALGQRPARMVRQGRWKLNSYHGFETPQLFDREADPDETHDLGRDPRLADLRRELLSLVSDGWSGADVERQARLDPAESAIARNWQASVHTRESERWRLPPGANLRA